jgi:hypothetical protein
MLLCITVENDPVATDNETSKLLNDIELIASPDVNATIPASPIPSSRTKGDPVTLGAIVLASVAAGGAITRAVSPGGFCSKLAALLLERSKRNVRFHVVTRKKQTLELVGSADDIAKLLKAGLLADIQI